MFKRDKLTTNKRQYAAYWAVAALFAIYAVMLIYPFFWSFLSSFMTMAQCYEGFGKLTLPRADSLAALFANYAKALEITVNTNGTEHGLLDMIFNTISISLLRTALSVIFPVCTAYSCAKYDNQFMRFYFFYGIVLCSIPLYGNVSAVYSVLYRLNIYDSYGAVALMSITPFANFLFYYGFFRAVSWGYAEAAFIDGASDFRVFWQIMLPQVLPAVMVFVINSAIGNWNDWMTSYLYFPSRPMIAYGTFQLHEIAMKYGDWPTLFAFIWLSVIPPLAFFLIFHKKIMETVYVGGLKG